MQTNLLCPVTVGGIAMGKDQWKSGLIAVIRIAGI